MYSPRAIQDQMRGVACFTQKIPNGRSLYPRTRDKALKHNGSSFSTALRGCCILFSSLGMAGLSLLIMFAMVGVVIAEPNSSFCLSPSLQDVLFAGHEKCMDADLGLSPTRWLNPPRVSELDDASLERALNILQTNDTYMALLFYASWCPFSKACRYVFDDLSSMFPKVHHVAVEESVVMPSVLSRYGVHSFPSLFLQNLTLRVRYHGSREPESLVAFYNKFTGIEPSSLDPLAKDYRQRFRKLVKMKGIESIERSPYLWEIPPEKILQQEPYLALAVLFLLFRLFFFIFPKILLWVKWSWISHVWHSNLAILSENTPSFLEQTLHIFNLNRIWSSLKLSKTGNFQGPAMNARVWASSLASVSLGEGSLNRPSTNSETR